MSHFFGHFSVSVSKNAMEGIFRGYLIPSQLSSVRQKNNRYHLHL